MTYQLMVIMHILGACVWLGGHVVLVGAVLPTAISSGQIDHLKRFVKGFGRLGLPALILQLLTGIWLANRWIPSWSGIFTEPTPQGHLVLTKLLLIALSVPLAGYTYHRAAPRLSQDRMIPFVAVTAAIAALAALMLIAGVGVRTGGLV